MRPKPSASFSDFTNSRAVREKHVFYKLNNPWYSVKATQNRVKAN